MVVKGREHAVTDVVALLILVGMVTRYEPDNLDNPLYCDRGNGLPHG